MLDRLPFRLGLPVATLGWLAALSILAGGGILVFGRPGPVPPAANLVELKGEVASVDVYDLAGKPTQGDWFPGLTTIRFWFKGVPDAFEYPAGYPLYFLVRDALHGRVIVRVEGSDFGSLRRVWQLEVPNRNLIVAYDDIAATLARIDASSRSMGGGMLGIGAALALGAWLAALVNRRLPKPSAKARERWIERRDGVTARLLDAVGALEGLYEAGARACAAILGNAVGRGVWSTLWACLYFGGAIAIGVAVYGG
jgi:hypothetical protein